tara:strand:- start:647 stop:2719 length:2073 start_codon:yes stop_codon:yes gene_type:complete
MAPSNQTINNTHRLKILWLAIFLYTLALCAPWFNLSISNHTFVKSYVAFFGSGLLFLSTLYINRNTENKALRISFIKISALFLFSLGVFSILWSVNLDFTFTKLFLWISSMFCFMVGLNLKIISEELRKLAWILLITGSLISLIGITQYYIDPFSLAEAVSPGSTFGNKNVANQALILLLPFSFYLFSSRDQGILMPWLISFLATTIIVFIFLTENRSAILSILTQLVFLIIFLIIKNKDKNKKNLLDKNKISAILLFAIAAVLIIKIPSLNFETVKVDMGSISSIDNLDNSEKSISIDSRFHIWSSAISMIKDSPIIGTGLGSFAHNIGNEGYSSLQVKGFQRSHNDVLETIVELGIFGLIGLILLVTSILTSIHKIYTSSSKEIVWFYYIVFVSLTGTFVNAQFSFPFQQAMPLILIGLFLGIIANQHDKSSSTIKIINFNFNYKKLIFGFFCCIFLSVSFIYIGWINAYNVWNDNNFKGQYNDLSFLETPIYHSGALSLLSRTSAKYLRNNDYKTSMNIDNHIIKRWPNHIISLFRLGYSSNQIGHNKDALVYADKLKTIEPPGLYGNYIIKMLAYISENKTKEFHQTFNELLSQPEHLLAIDTNTYHYLLFFTLESKKLSPLASSLYEKYIKNHGFSCEVENNIAIHYFNLEEFEKAAYHVNEVFQKGEKCLNPLLIEYLNNKQLL